MRYLGIDYGENKVGLALSDEAGTMGFPRGVVANTPELADAISSLVRDQEVGGIVIGESKNLEGGENAIASAARTFGDSLHERTGVPVFYEDERFTSAEARRQYEPSEKTRAPTAREDVDASAAALILTSFLTKHDHLG